MLSYKASYSYLYSVEIGEFQSLVGSFIGMVDELAREVEREKMKAIGARNLLKSIARERESQKQQLQALLIEKKMELERYNSLTICMHVCVCVCVCVWSSLGDVYFPHRLHVQYESLKQVEQDQLEITEDFGLK